MEPSITVQRVYVKELSLEMPHAPAIFLEAGQLAVNLDASISHQALAEGVMEVVVRGTLTAKLGEKTVYLVELHQAGIFEHKGLSQEQLDEVINVACPNMLYPYLRANIADTLVRASQPVFHVPDVNWAALFVQSKQQLAEAAPVGGVH